MPVHGLSARETGERHSCIRRQQDSLHDPFITSGALWWEHSLSASGSSSHIEDASRIEIVCARAHAAHIAARPSIDAASQPGDNLLNNLEQPPVLSASAVTEWASLHTNIYVRDSDELVFGVHSCCSSAKQARCCIRHSTLQRGSLR